MVLTDAQKRAMKKYQQKNKEMMAENSQRYRETHPSLTNVSNRGGVPPTTVCI